MLVFVPGKVVLSVHVSPVNIFWKLFVANNFPSWSTESLWVNSIFALLKHASSIFGRVLIKEVLGLLEHKWIDSRVVLVVVWIILLFLSGDVFHSLSPGINWTGPGALTLDVQVVDSSDESEKSFFSPVGSPRVSDVPVFLTIFFSPSNNADNMIVLLSASVVDKDSMSVVLESIGDRNHAGNWSSLVNFLHDVSLTRHFVVLVNLVNVVRVWNKAGFTWITVSAHGDVGARVSIIMASGSVDRTGLVSNVVFKYVFVGGEWVTTVAALAVLSFARDQYLRSNVDIWPSSVSHDLDSI